MGRESPRAIPYRVLLAVPAAVILFIAVIPWITDWLETGQWPRNPREFTTELIGTGMTLALGWWILTLIHREHRDTSRYFKELERLTLTDPLTGLGNRRALERDLEMALRRAQREGAPLALLFMDLDGLKALNDRFGHGVGDETLRVLGAVLRSNSRLGTDTAYRVGGDEFVMTLTADGTGAELLSQRVKREFRGRSPKGSGLSLGVVVWDGHMNAGQLLDEADTRMYESKLPGWAERRPG